MRIGNISILPLLVIVGCASQQPARLAGDESVARNCLYAGESFSVGETTQSKRSVSDGNRVTVIDDPSGVLMRCDRTAGSVRWNVFEPEIDS